MNLKLKIAIVDDRPLEIASLTDALSRQSSVEVVATAASQEEALRKCQDTQPDLVLLDISLEGDTDQSGFDIAALLNQMPNAPSVIFVTAHPEFALEAHEYHPSHFLTKPVRDEKLAEVLARVRQDRAARLRGQQSTLAIKYSEVNAFQETLKATVYVRPRDIVYFETRKVKDDGGRDGTLNAHLVTETLGGVHARLDFLELLLSPYEFFRIHSSYLVNLRHAYRLRPHPGDNEAYRLSFSDRDVQLPIARHRLNALRLALANLYC